MSPAHTADKVLALVRGVAGVERSLHVGVESQLLDEGILDSFGLVTLVAELDTAFSISISTEDLIAQNFDTVGDIARLVDRYIGSGA